MALPSVHPTPTLGARLWRLRYTVGYLAVYLTCLGGFAYTLARFRDPHSGYSSLILFGEHFSLRRLPRLGDVPLYTYAHHDGYDGQFYAQIAVAGNPFDRALGRALDDPAYRERRLLLPLAAHLVGLGRPGAIVQIFALANLFCLALLAALLARWWFPPTDLHNLCRWAAVVFGAGMVVSAARSLTDGPALLLVAIGIRQIERGRTWPAAAVLALAGLARETSLLAAIAFWPPPGATAPARRRALLAALACVGPIAVWMAILAARYGRVGGLDNLAPPFWALSAKARELSAAWRARGFDAAVRDEILVAVGLGVQIVFVVARPRPAEPWWRVGAAFATLAALLGWPVWEGFPSAVARAALPLTLAFNRLAPRTRAGLALLLAGNLGLFALPDLLEAYAPTEQLLFTGGVGARYDAGGLAPEHAGRDTWRWATGPATIALGNPGQRPRAVSVDFALRSVTARVVTVAAAGAPPLRVVLPPDARVPVHLGPFPLPPGRTDVVFSTDASAWHEPGGGRPLAFAVYGFYTAVSPAL
ncbi:MAG TPA: hypothetical protein VI456_14525 [Polyangia bacterium]